MRARPIPALEPFDLLSSWAGRWTSGRRTNTPGWSTEKAAIRHWVAELAALTSACASGHQLLADALGGTVGPMDEPEIGVDRHRPHPERRGGPVFGQPARVPCRACSGTRPRWSNRPPGATVLAGNEHSAVQALRVGRAAWGVQFHLEVEPARCAKWAAVPEYERTLAETSGACVLSKTRWLATCPS